MGIITGKEFIDRINQLNKDIWFDGKKIEGNLSEHPAFKGIMQSKASLYDLQADQNLKTKLTYLSAETGETIGLSYLQPKTKHDLRMRRKMIELWAKHSNGMMGRSPDYMNTAVMAFASSTDLLVAKENCFPENIQSLYERAKKEDLSFTHTFITPQVNRSQLHFESSKEPISAKVIGENENGIIIKGARLLATQGGLTDEVLVYSAGGVFNESEAYAFSIPSDTKGLKFICRESFAGGDSSFNYPLSSRYEEMDTILVFDQVLVPWDRVFFYNNVEVANHFLLQSSFHHFATHQVITRQIIKTEFLLGVAELLVETIQISEFQHIQEKLAEIIIGLETMKALLVKSEVEANLDECGYMRPSIIPLQVASIIYPKIYPRFCEIIQIVGASGMISIPTEKDFDSIIRTDLDQYLKGANTSAENRVKIFRLAWDLTMSSFGTRQTQYERYFFGDPIRLSSHLYKTYAKENHVKHIVDFLNIK
ncbi:4-hydroxyphenylacetate 3-monooxygenase oxygenase component [Neobacillus rhizosphaerae]|uniref:4-hydroxyphenylacetate 3-monooxygenase oxygenase component n=1 Tax=Neobacillus rhizosphaerae TaxID=2880965 RepID=A0ABM9EKU9_9BACI|nr:4-hydroxyphenylacetate 3-monooxygenase, oxygenase component [Neobacillus rhizosphaerae]CAH2713194.1 4-hydroxyphenylacetate 3-monooxygenase oxygenase component [Neobacillus rhizosphaerae]